MKKIISMALDRLAWYGQCLIPVIHIFVLTGIHVLI